jgi:Family of unknown function (DUF6152)
MTKNSLLAVIVGTAWLMAPGALLAHHGANLYDMTKTVTVKGTVAKFYWGNPHNEITIDATDDKGAATQWVAYTEPPLVMLERGWTRKSLNFGDKVTAYIFAAKNGSTVGTLNRIVLPDGKELTAYPMPGAPAVPNPPANLRSQ